MNIPKEFLRGAGAAVLALGLLGVGQRLVGQSVSGSLGRGQQASGQTKSAARRWAVVEFSANVMREAPQYTAELGNQALMGTVVELLDTSGLWVKIKSPEPYTAWTNELGLVPMDGKQVEDYLAAPKYICTAVHSHILSEPSEGSQIVSELVMGDLVRILYKTFTHTSGRYKGYEEGRAVLTKRFVGVVLPSGKTGYVRAEDVKVFHKWAKDKQLETYESEAFASDLVQTAMRLIGVPYLWGGTSVKNVDCSGLTRTVYFSNGVLLPRNASQQAGVGEEVSIFKDDGSVSWDALEPGDLIFWGSPAGATTGERVSHVGMYIGEGRFIHSSQVVRSGSLDRSAPDFYDRRPLRARRVIGHIDQPGSGAVSIFRSPAYFPQE